MPTSELVKRFSFESTGEIMNEIRNSHIDGIQQCWNERISRVKNVSQSDQDVKDADLKNERDAHFGVGTPKTIGEPAYWDLIKCTKSIHGRHPTPIVSSNWAGVDASPHDSIVNSS